MLLPVAFICCHIVLFLNISFFLTVKALQMIEELLIAACLYHGELMWIPELSPDRFNIMLVHAK